MSPCDVRHLVRWAVISLISGGLFAAGLLYYSDRLGERATTSAHQTVIENKKEILALRTQVAEVQQQLKVCIEKKERH